MPEPLLAADDARSRALLDQLGELIGLRAEKPEPTPGDSPTTGSGSPIRRSLKRYFARQIYRQLNTAAATAAGA